MKAGYAIIAFLCACFLSGCMHTVHLYPIQGPLAAQSPPLIYTGKITADWNSGTISATLANGQQFSGQWQGKSAGALAKESKAGVVPPFNLSAEWDVVYGPGFYTTHILGAHGFARAKLAGKPGGVLQFEMVSLETTSVENPAGPKVKGVARDDKGNVYKVAF